jgi:glutaredoxin
MNAIIYGTNKCTWCDKVANTLLDAGIDITKVDVTEPEKLDEMLEIAGKDARTVPQVVIDGKYIGGYTETERFLGGLKRKNLIRDGYISSYE